MGLFVIIIKVIGSNLCLKLSLNFKEQGGVRILKMRSVVLEDEITKFFLFIIVV